MIGRIRLENPDRGFALVSWIGPLLAVSGDGGETWEISTLFDGLEYFGQTPLLRSEVRALPSGVAGPDLDHWRWIAMPSVGPPRSLPPEAQPKRTDLARLAFEAVSLFPADLVTLPTLDWVEIWLCDKATRKPLARVSSALSLERALAKTHVGPFHMVEPWSQTPETWSFQERLNARLNRARRRGRYRFIIRLYERTESGAVRLGRRGVVGPVKPGHLPKGPLAEPWESSRRAILDRLSAREPGRVPPSATWRRLCNNLDSRLGPEAASLRLSSATG